jgi:very-short-patch-repair endonuclease
LCARPTRCRAGRGGVAGAAARGRPTPDHSYLEVDLYWPSHRLIVESDGYETHGTRAAFEADRRRDAALTAAGYRVIRFTTRTPEAAITERLRALLTP